MFMCIYVYVFQWQKKAENKPALCQVSKYLKSYSCACFYVWNFVSFESVEHLI
jgi:hypothetical protein